MALLILTKTTHDHYHFLFIRDDGTQTSRTLETRSLLRHDFAHYVVESFAQLHDSFYGMLASGKSVSEFSDFENELALSLEARQTEMVVALLQQSTEKQTDTMLLYEKMCTALTTMGFSVPDYMTPEKVVLLQQRFQMLYATWQTLRTGEEMKLEWSTLE